MVILNNNGHAILKFKISNIEIQVKTLIYRNQKFLEALNIFIS